MQRLNYKSVNERYGEKRDIPKYKYKNVEVNTGIILGCIDCYIYQSSEANDFFESKLFYSLQRLKDAMLTRFIKNEGQEIPWGLD